MRPVTPRRVHEIAGKDEEGNGEKREAFHARNQTLRRDDIWRDIIRDDVEKRCRGH